MTTPTAESEHRLVELLDAIDESVSIASAIRDREGRILGDGYLSTWRLQSATPELG